MSIQATLPTTSQQTPHRLLPARLYTPRSVIPEELSQWIETATGLSADVQVRLVLSLAVVLLLWVLRRLILAAAWRRTDDVKVRYQWRKFTGYVAFLLAAAVLTPIWLRGFTGVATYLGLLSAGVAIALREPLVNLVAWVFLIWRRPFEVGDRIQIGDHAGDVIDQRIFQFSLLEIGNWVDADQSTGRVIHVPNGRVFVDAVANYTRGFAFIWNEIPVLVTFESDWRKAKELLQHIGEEHGAALSDAAREEVRKASRRFMIFYSNLTPTVYTSVEDSGVLLTIRYLCGPRRRRGSEQAIWEDILTAFAEHTDIDFAYPTRRYYDNVGEGKPGARSPDLAHSGVDPDQS